MKPKPAGRELEEATEQLLRLAHYNVKRERLIGPKKVDLYLERRDLARRIRTAVECKDYGDRLTQEQLNRIYSNYLPLYQANQIDSILVVTRFGLTPTAETFLEQTRELLHLTIRDLAREVMDFDSYLGSVRAQFCEDGLHKYYIPARTVEGDDAEEIILDWVDSEGAPPIAILASYGMGKTSLARRLAFVLGHKYSEQESDRVPIYIKLGDITAEQSLEGLLGRLLTARSVVGNYSFDAFMELNRLGRFVILLDGFDEMKHTLSWTEFRFNFRELNRLVKGRSKVVLFGRPTAFLNDAEQRHALHGIRVVKGVEFREPDWPDYTERHLDRFTRAQVAEFLERYLHYKESIAQTPRERKNLERLRQGRIEEISGKKLADIARRPVQLKMLVEVLPQWSGTLDNLTVSILYSLFIDLIIERDLAKISRSRFGLEERKRFARKLATWLWTLSGERAVTADDIPDEVLTQFVATGEDPEAVKRDLVSACFLERRLGGSLYFPHRSFQEFLVAEWVVEAFKTGEVSPEELSAIVTEEVGDFLEGLVSERTLVHWRRVLRSFRGTLPWRIARLWLSSPRYIIQEQSEFEKLPSPWSVLLISLGIAMGVAEGVDRQRFEAQVLKWAFSGGGGQPALLGVFCLFIMSKATGDPTSVERGIHQLLEAGKLVEYRDDEGLLRRRLAIDPLCRELLLRMTVSKRGELDVGGGYKVIASNLRNYCMIQEWFVGSTLIPNPLKVMRKVKVSGSVAAAVKGYRERYRNED